MGRRPITPEEKKARKKEFVQKNKDKINMRRRFIYKYPITDQKCERCPDPAEIRHHLSNDVDDIELLCKDCYRVEHKRY